MKDIEIFKGMNYSDLLKEIHTTTNKQTKQIEQMIDQMKHLIHCSDDAAVVAPFIASFFEALVKNDEHLIKMASIIQKIITAENKGKGANSIEDLLSEEEKDALVRDATKELAEAVDEYEQLNKTGS